MLAEHSKPELDDVTRGMKGFYCQQSVADSSLRLTGVNDGYTC
ncbi:hypothetical protein EM595_1920 [Duffyella gerundensis]|uniref:Uncharacterized protein n=1 Tax=Duffyella gerundensis TaxID=1619313 RepID=A0A0U5L0F5_9GAMM|nr:hypothetical protein EM595_1920 [Duffyella gerundensis]